MEPSSDLVRIAHVRAVSDGLVLICESPDGRRFGVPVLEIHPTSEVRRPGDSGTLVIPEWLAQNLGLDGVQPSAQPQHPPLLAGLAPLRR